MALIDKASLLMVPSTYEAGTLYNVLPSGNRAPDSTGQNSGYDQTRADFTFDRGSNAAATRVNSDGLIEKYRENKLLQSNAFSTSPWVSNNLTLTSGQADKDGGTDAWLLSITGGTNSQRLEQDVVLSSIATFSIYVKAGTLNWVRLRTDGATTRNNYFDLENGVIGTTSGIDAKIESVGNGWFRCSAVTDDVTRIRVYPADADGDVTHTSGNIYIQNAQLETGLVATDYLDSGATTAKAGVLIDLPRINYDANGENGALLLEPSRQQLLQYSEYFSASGVWLPNTITITDNYGTSPEGLSNSTRLVLGNLTASRIAYAPTLTNGTTYTFSCWYKGTAGEKLYMEGNGSGGSGTQTSKLITLTGDWQREDLQFVGGSTSNLIYIVDSRNGVEDTAQDFEVFGAQLEAGLYATSYIPNHGESGGVTRAADSCYNLDGMSSIIGQTEGTIFCEFTLLSNENTDHRLSISSGASVDWIFVAIPEDGVNTRMYVRINGTAVIDIDSNQFTKGNTYKIAFAYKSGDSAIYINGNSEVTSSTAFGSPSVTLDTFGISGSNAGSNTPQHLSNSIKQVALFKKRLSNAELAALTA